MITSANVDYSELFAKANAVLQTREDYAALGSPVIDSLTAYFSYLNLLKQTGNLDFIRLPTDEDCLEINANTRVITVPSIFKNGVGLENDHLAEILYFTIDRYFDGQDLSICDPNIDSKGSITIDWINAKGEMFSSKAYSVNATDNEGLIGGDKFKNKIIFGWPLSNTAMAKAGSITFAVRFKHLNENGDLDFELNTRQEKIQVQAGLNISSEIRDELVQEDVSDIIANRKVYSGIMNSSYGNVATIIQDLPAELEFNEDGEAQLSISARPSYNTGATLLFNVYKYGASNPIATTEDDDSEYEEITTDAGITNFTYTISETGMYHIKVGNKLSAAEGGAVRWISSGTCVVPAAPQIVIDNFTTVVYLNESDAGITLTAPTPKTAQGAAISDKCTIQYQWYNNNDQLVGSNKTYIVPGHTADYYYVKITVSRNGSSEVAVSNKVRTVILPGNLPTIYLAQTDDGNYVKVVDEDGNEFTDMPHGVEYIWSLYNKINGSPIQWQLAMASDPIALTQYSIAGTTYDKITCQAQLIVDLNVEGITLTDEQRLKLSNVAELIL